MSQKYRAATHESLFLGFDVYLITLTSSGKRLVIPSNAKRVIDHCRILDTLEGHAGRVARRLKFTEDKKAPLMQLLLDLNAKGLLIPAAAFGPGKPQHLREHIPITSLVLITADRIEHFKRALASYSQNLTQFGRGVDMIVMDDSKNNGLRHEYLQNSANTSNVVRYAGRREKLSFIGQLTQCGIAPDLARFAILGEPFNSFGTIGANRNAALLDTIGEHVLSADDDTLCQFAVHPTRQEQLRFTSHENPRDAWFYGDRAKVQLETNWVPCDLLGEHERILGKYLGDLVAERSPDLVDLDKACDHLLEGIHSGEGKVIASMSGIVGDSGAICAQGFLTSGDEVRRKLWLSEKTFETAFLSREVLWIVQSDTISHSGTCQATTLGLANTEILAPFFPFGRNEDGAFGLLNQLIAPAAFLGHVPVAVFHQADLGKTYEVFPPFRTSELFMSLLSTLPLGPSSSTQGLLRRIGTSLSEIAKLREREFSAYLLQAVSQSQAEALRLLDSLSRDSEESPAYWKREVRKYFEHITTRLKTGDYVPQEVRQNYTGQEGGKKVREVVGMAGAFLQAWPDMVEACAYLKARGTRISLDIQAIKD